MQIQKLFKIIFKKWYFISQLSQMKANVKMHQKLVKRELAAVEKMQREKRRSFASIGSSTVSSTKRKCVHDIYRQVPIWYFISQLTQMKRMIKRELVAAEKLEGKWRTITIYSFNRSWYWQLTYWKDVLISAAYSNREFTKFVFETVPMVLSFHIGLEGYMPRQDLRNPYLKGKRMQEKVVIIDMK